MTVEQLVRDQLARATREVVGGPDLATSIRAGRRRRRTARVGVAARRRGRRWASARSASRPRWAATTPARSRTTTRCRRAARPGRRRPRPTSCPAPTSTTRWPPWSPSTCPSLPAPDDVYPSDGTTAGPTARTRSSHGRRTGRRRTPPTPAGFLVIDGAARGGRRLALQRLRRARRCPAGRSTTETYSTDGGRTSVVRHLPFVGRRRPLRQRVRVGAGFGRADRRGPAAALRTRDLEALVRGPATRRSPELLARGLHAGVRARAASPPRRLSWLRPTRHGRHARPGPAPAGPAVRPARRPR